jgi:hypothetical protein
LRCNRHRDLTPKLAGRRVIDIGVAAENPCGELPTGQCDTGLSREIAPVERERCEGSRDDGDSEEYSDMVRCETSRNGLLAA